MISSQQLHQKIERAALALGAFRTEQFFARLTRSLKIGNSQEKLAKLGGHFRIPRDRVLLQRLEGFLLGCSHLLGLLQLARVGC